MAYRLRAWTLGIVLLAALSSPAHAAWTLVSADSPVTVVRATNVFAFGTGESLRTDDLVLSPRQGVVQIQDDNGTLVALGAQSRVMLQADERIALLRGWIKIAYACKAASCPQRIVETERGVIRLSTGASTAAIVATPDDAGDIAVFSESGAQTLALKPPLTIDAGSFAAIPDSAPAHILPRPSSAFLAAMPAAFRDALQPLAIDAKPSSAVVQPLRAATYDDIAPWLTSTLSARKRFAARFHARLADSAFRASIASHLNALPDWRVFLYPPARATHSTVRYP
ncbi:hypothetical protein [Paraburkholderia sediminicola]|uniref:hypothetical protein n=1 Tax=Paraburkholderia sediminicola TaxID=458836 RepID=UPI0038B7BC84